MTTEISPNTQVSAATESPAVPSLDSIAQKMTAMREQTLRNQLRATEEDATGTTETAESEVPVATDNVPEVDESNDEYIGESTEESDSPEQVTTGNSDSTADELIDFIEFAETNPNAKFKFMRNGKEVVIDAKKAAAILGQGSAIHEEARELKIQKAEFEEYLNQTRAKTEGLALAMEFTIEPRLRNAYDEIVKTQGYQTTFQKQLQQTKDPAMQARIQASMAQNEQYIRQQQQLIGQLKPQVDQFRSIRSQQIAGRLDEARRNFSDKELKNEYVYNEIREKVAKIWPHAKEEIIPGVPNIDLISSDENLLSLVRDGLKYRQKPNSKSAGSSLAQLTNRKGSTTQRSNDDNISKLREQAKSGDKKAADNLLVAQLQKIRASRGGR
jgi:hypothetical protein